MTRTHLQRLESESIQLLREAIAASDCPVVAVGRRGGDESLLLHLARKAFYPAEPPFPRISCQAAPAAGDEGPTIPVWRIRPLRGPGNGPIRVFPIAAWTDADVQEYGQRENLELGALRPPGAARRRRLLRVVAAGGAGAAKQALIAALPEFTISLPAENDVRSLVSANAIADVALIVVDAVAGLELTTRRHAALVALLGVRHVALVVDLANVATAEDAQAAFERTEAEFRRFAAGLGLAAVTAIAVSTATGGYLRQRSASMPWCTGPAVAELLDTVERDVVRPSEQPLRFPIQLGNRVADFRGYAGTIVAGRVRKGIRFGFSRRGASAASCASSPTTAIATRPGRAGDHAGARRSGRCRAR